MTTTSDLLRDPVTRQELVEEHRPVLILQDEISGLVRREVEICRQSDPWLEHLIESSG